MRADWEYSDDNCPKCESEMVCRTCYMCGGEGALDDDDEEWGGAELCDNCSGQGYEEWCRECGWDETFNCFLSSEYERAHKAGQQQELTNAQTQPQHSR